MQRVIRDREREEGRETDRRQHADTDRQNADTDTDTDTDKDTDTDIDIDRLTKTNPHPTQTNHPSPLLCLHLQFTRESDEERGEFHNHFVAQILIDGLLKIERKIPGVVVTEGRRPSVSK